MKNANLPILMVSLHVCSTVCQSLEIGSYTDFDTPFSGWFSYSGVSLLPCPSPNYFPVVLVVQVSSYKSCAKEAQIFYQSFNFSYTMIILRAKQVLVIGSHFFLVLTPFLIFHTLQSPQRDFFILFRF